ncbi:MAG: GNAT family N-acetyltransferase [Gammaproteobacteria bacterium]|nr:GNAT family N-acetyltransferase [Gammaproteobacteria bacterium]
MIRESQVVLARHTDAAQISRMSKELIEHDLGWSWKQGRIIQSIRCPDRNVAVVKNAQTVVAFGIMEYGLEVAHLLLFAVQPDRRRQKIGSQLLEWLEETAIVAGVGCVSLETRLNNRGGRRFYRAHGFEEVGVVRGYYSGQESAVRMVHQLHNQSTG